MRFTLTHSGLHIPDYIGQDDMRRPIRHASEFWDHYGVAVHPAQRLPGDLVFFTRRGQMPRHIGIVYDKAHYVHAPGSDGTKVCIEPIAGYPLIKPPLDAGRVLYTTNPIGFKSPTMPVAQPTYRYHQQPI